MEQKVPGGNGPVPLPPPTAPMAVRPLIVIALDAKGSIMIQAPLKDKEECMRLMGIALQMMADAKVSSLVIPRG